MNKNKFEVEVITEDCDIQSTYFSTIEEALLHYVMEMQREGWYSIYVWDHTEDGLKPYAYIRKV